MNICDVLGRCLAQVALGLIGWTEQRVDYGGADSEHEVKIVMIVGTQRARASRTQPGPARGGLSELGMSVETKASVW